MLPMLSDVAVTPPPTALQRQMMDKHDRLFTVSMNIVILESKFA
jgi:hypothetical protein